MIEQKTWDGLCWWCESDDLSGEHKHKQTDVKRWFDGDFKGDNQPVRIKDREEGMKFIQGPNSGYLKFDKNLCKACNGAKSQSFDTAYDKLMDYVFSNSEELLNTQKVNLSDVFGQDWLEQKAKVWRYFVKEICCRLIANNISISNDLIEFLDGSDKLNSINISFEFRVDIWAMCSKLNEFGFGGGNLYMAPLNIIPDLNSIERVESFYNNGWLRWKYQYFSKSDGSETFGNKILDIPAFYVIDPQELMNAKSSDELQNLQDLWVE